MLKDTVPKADGVWLDMDQSSAMPRTLSMAQGFNVQETTPNGLQYSMRHQPEEAFTQGWMSSRPVERGQLRLWDPMSDEFEICIRAGQSAPVSNSQTGKDGDGPANSPNNGLLGLQDSTHEETQEARTVQLHQIASRGEQAAHADRDEENEREKEDGQGQRQANNQQETLPFIASITKKTRPPLLTRQNEQAVQEHNEGSSTSINCTETPRRSGCLAAKKEKMKNKTVEQQAVELIMKKMGISTDTSGSAEEAQQIFGEQFVTPLSTKKIKKVKAMFGIEEGTGNDLNALTVAAGMEEESEKI